MLLGSYYRRQLLVCILPRAFSSTTGYTCNYCGAPRVFLGGETLGTPLRVVMTNTLNNLRALSKRHVLAITCALVCGVLILAPQIVFIVHEGNNYKGLYMMKTESEWYYLARMQEVYDEGRIGNPFLFEHKWNGPIFVSPGGETILAIPGRLLNISVPTINLIYKFFLPAITFLLLYALIFRLTASVVWSVTGALMFLVGSTWLYANNLSHLLRGDLWFDGFVYNRPVHPQFDGMLTFLYLNVLLSVFRSPKARWFVALAALLGLSFYTYLYSFTFFLALNFVFVLLWLCFGRKREARNLSIATFFGIVLGLPALFAIYEATKHPDYVYMVYSTDHGHLPEISKNGILVSLLLIGYFFYAKATRAVDVVRQELTFLCGLLVTTFVVVNQQVLTGVSLYSGHYHHNFNIPIFVVVLMFLASVVVARFLNTQPKHTRSNLEGSVPKVRPRIFWFDLVLRLLPWVLSVVFIATGAFVQYSSYYNWAPQTSEEQKFMPALSWLKEHTEKDSVVMANEALSEIIPVFTENNVMWSSGATNYLVPPERLRFTPENLLQSNDFLRDIRQYRVDYILWDEKADPNWRIDRFRLPLLFASEGLVIYQLPK